MMASRTTTAFGAAALLLLAGSALAQPATSPTTTPATTTTTTTTQTAVVRSSGVPQRDTLMRMMRPVSIEFKEHRLEDVIRFLGEVTQADMEVFWLDDRNSSGLDKDTPITLRFDRGTALDLLEKVLDKARTDSIGQGSSWQLDSSGTLQIGPKDRLNRFKTVKLYSIADLLIEIPDYVDAPEFDLQSVLQDQGGQGGGGQSPFRDAQQQAPDRKPLEDRVREIQDIIVSLVETEQWVDNGGDGASIRFFQGSFLVNAPDYIHRQIDGYPYWPAADTRVATVNGRRYVSLGVNTAANKVRGFRNVDVPGIAGGGSITPNAPGGPGGSATPPASPGTGPK
jgi:hypothetical protein